MGTLLIDSGVPSFEGGVAHVWVEEPAPADAPARRLAELRLDRIAHHAGTAEAIPFAIDAPIPLPAGARLRAWVDIASRGTPGRDDLYSTEATAVSDAPCVLRVERSGR